MHPYSNVIKNKQGLPEISEESNIWKHKKRIVGKQSKNILLNYIHQQAVKTDIYLFVL